MKVESHPGFPNNTDAVPADTLSVDGSLVELAREGSESAFLTLVNRYLPMIRKQAAVLRRFAEDDDLAQEGLTGLFAAVRTYDPSKAAFSTYAGACVRNHLLSVARKLGAARAIPASGIVSIDEGFEDVGALSDERDDPAHLIAKREDEIRLYRRLRVALSGNEYRVLTLYIQNYSYREIGEKTGMTSKAVDNALQRARRKLISTSLSDG